MRGVDQFHSQKVVKASGTYAIRSLAFSLCKLYHTMHAAISHFPEIQAVVNMMVSCLLYCRRIVLLKVNLPFPQQLFRASIM